MNVNKSSNSEPMVSSRIRWIDSEQKADQQPKESVGIKPALALQEMSIEEKAQIKNLIRMVANDSIPSLIGQLPKLMAAKRSLHKIHPLKSFEFMLKDPDVVKNLKILSKTPQRWVGVPFFAPNKGFKPQSAEKFMTYHAEGTVLSHLPEFIKSIGFKQKQAMDVSQLANDGKWAEMIQYLADEAKTQS